MTHFDELSQVGRSAVSARDPASRPRPGVARVLIATGFGADPIATEIERVLAAGLSGRGMEVDVLLCDGVLPGCVRCTPNRSVNSLRLLTEGTETSSCPRCYDGARRTLEATGARVHRLGDYLTVHDRRLVARLTDGMSVLEMKRLRFKGVDVGRYATASALEFYGRASLGQGSLNGEVSGGVVLRQYLRAAILTAAATERFLREHRFDVAVSHYGPKTPQGIIIAICAGRRVRVVSWWTGFRRNCVIVSEQGFNPMLADESIAEWEGRPWTPAMDGRITEYLESRLTGAGDWELDRTSAGGRPTFDHTVITGRGLPYIGMWPNLRWEIPTGEPDAAFTTSRDWVFATIDYFARRRDLQLFIRLHPYGPDVGKLAMELIRTRYPSLPDNVTVIPADRVVDMRELIRGCKAALTWNSTTGLELAAAGMPVIVSGPAWMRYKGFTRDARSAAGYSTMLDALPGDGRLDEHTTRRARQCAYHFFFRHMIPLTASPRGLDVICDGIIEGRPFLFPAEC